jgi:hypothetical protein
MSKLHDVWVGTYTNKRFRPFDPRPEDVDIEDIAHSLAHQCRFNGHCGMYYSVAEHSLLVASNVAPEFALWGLMHDAAEAYISDIVRPIKARLFVFCGEEWGDGEPDYSQIRVSESRILRVIARKFGLVWPMPTEVETADLRALATERDNLFDEDQPEWTDLAGVTPYDTLLACMTPRNARWHFLERFSQLSRKA